MDFKYPYTDAHELNLDWFLAQFKNLTENWAQVQSDWNDLHDYVQNYFDNLDVQDEINNKIQSMIDDNSFATILTPLVAAALPTIVDGKLPDVVAAQIGAVVAAQIDAVIAGQLPAAVAGEAADWLAAHVDPDTGYVIDDTLTITDAAADAKVVGDNITSIKSVLFDPVTLTGWVNGEMYDGRNGNIISDSSAASWSRALIDISSFTGYTKLKLSVTGSGDNRGLCFFTADNTFISGLKYSSGLHEYDLDLPSNCKYIGISSRTTLISDTALSFVISTSAFDVVNNKSLRNIKNINQPADLDNAADNSIIYTSKNTTTGHFPESFFNVGYFITIPFNASNKLQIGYSAYGNVQVVRSSVSGTWSNWVKINTDGLVTEDEYMVDSSLAMFADIGCVGDSFTAGYLYNKSDSEYYDPDYVPDGSYPAIGWPAVIGRLYGITATAYAKAGATTGSYINDKLPELLADDPKNLYVLCLGLNDKTQNTPVGVEADLDDMPDTPTMLGNYGYIIRSIMAHAPNAKLIICKSFWVYNAGATTPNGYYNYISPIAELISSHFGFPYIETLDDPYFKSSYYVNGLKGLHPTAPLYAGLARRLGQLIDKSVIDNPSYFFNFYIPN